jgi:biotin carboxyl carrier protein
MSPEDKKVRVMKYTKEILDSAGKNGVIELEILNNKYGLRIHTTSFPKPQEIKHEVSNIQTPIKKYEERKGQRQKDKEESEEYLASQDIGFFISLIENKGTEVKAGKLIGIVLHLNRLSGFYSEIHGTIEEFLFESAKKIELSQEYQSRLAYFFSLEEKNIPNDYDDDLKEVIKQLKDYPFITNKKQAYIVECGTLLYHIKKSNIK